MRATLYKRSDDPWYGRTPVAFASRNHGKIILASIRWGGLTLHRAGGFSIVGIPRDGGTTVAWGRRLLNRMDALARECTVYRLGPISVYTGADF